MSALTVNAAWLLPNATDPAVADVAIGISEGRIAAIDPSTVKGGGLALPALANAHDHARFTRLSQSGSFDVPLEAWLPYLTLIPSVDPWLSSVVSFARSARGGTGAIMAHYTRVQGLTDFPAEAMAVAQAARDVGVRVALAVHCRDRNPIVYGPHDKLLKQLSPAACACPARRRSCGATPVSEQIAMVEVVAAEVVGDGVTIRPAGCSGAPTRCSKASRMRQRAGRRVHMHLWRPAINGLGRTRPTPTASCVILIGSGLSTSACRLRIAFGCDPRKWTSSLSAAQRSSATQVQTSS
jgi:cytosine/adenosine deaminase-related metal-dependent hydrolase